MKLLGLLSVAVLFGSSAMASTCPLGAGEDHLTIQRVMRNFGKYTAGADAVVSVGATPSDDDVLRAIADLSVVSACASESANATSPDLIPSSARKDAAVATQFRTAMSEFMIAVDAEASALQLARSSHDFTDARTKKKIVDQLADDAHSRF